MVTTNAFRLGTTKAKGKTDSNKKYVGINKKTRIFIDKNLFQS
jgi:hypothetical protein